jgi:hypothetical protein
MCSPSIEKLGASPANIQWTVVRGDTATLRVDFLEDDEVTAYDTSGWTFSASTYDPAGDFIDELVVESYDDGTVFIIASQDITANWGISKYKPMVAELRFDLPPQFLEMEYLAVEEILKQFGLQLLEQSLLSEM